MFSDFRVEKLVRYRSLDFYTEALEPLRQNAYSNILKISPPKKPESFQIKNLIFFIYLLKT